MISRLLNRLHRIFNKDPQAVPAITITRTGGATVTIALLSLTMVSDAGTHTIPLSGTVQDLADSVNAISGYTCTVTNSMGAMLSRGLIEGVQDISTDPSFGFPTSLLWNEMQTAAWAMDYPPGRLASAKAQLDMATADSDWLDIWCQDYFGTARNNSESDINYLARTVAEILAPTQNNLAIEIIVKASHGVDITLDDAVDHADLYTGRTSELPGRFHIIFPDGLSQAEKDAIRATIQKHKAGGTDFIYSPTRVPLTVSETITVSDAVYAVNRTGSFSESLTPGPIKYGDGWKYGTPGLKYGLNAGMQEQVFIKIKNLDGSTHALRLSGG